MDTHDWYKENGFTFIMSTNVPFTFGFYKFLYRALLIEGMNPPFDMSFWEVEQQPATKVEIMLPVQQFQ